ncbi:MULTISPECIES: hypothetical protein [Tsukamurella]|uniref:Nuclear transport factor 2 family protein n=2 Tax=Tsukamurella TaxID=2060 RepID=A0A5C5S060_9ACTN|nr:MULTISPECIES: hypothetical protein [Tsukamurella]NMD57916.1 hypothetical protein [Tsukamurella columbiensis]TWS27855.1 hypothetical protein FK530_15690 [Tsukamurella conjunctivitidis]
MDHAEIDDYLTRYAESLARFDATAGADLWAEPGMIVDDRFSGVLDDRATMARGLRQSYPLYRALGLCSVGHELLDAVPLTGAITLLHVRWLFRDDEGLLLTDSTGYYVVRRDHDGLHACVCIQVDDAAKLQSLATERGIDLADFLPAAPPAQP